MRATSFPIILHMHMAGLGLRYYFIKILNKGGFSITTMDELESVGDIMKLCYIVLDFQEEMAVVESSSSLGKRYELSERQVIISSNK